MTRANTGMGILAILIWLILFAAGVTIDSSPYRAVLAPEETSQGESEEGGASNPGLEGSPPVPFLAKAIAFLGVMTFYTPMNVALLTILSGLVGGCASRLTYEKAHREGIPEAVDPKQDLGTLYRIEHPVASLLRSFLVYLAFIAGIFITTNDPFGSPTPDQYVRLAGLLSFVSFVVGYDPTRFQELLSLRAGSGGK